QTCALPIWVRTDGSYLSASDVRVHVGLGPSPAVGAVVVQWPDGQRERWTGLAGDRLVTLRRGTGRPGGALKADNTFFIAAVPRRMMRPCRKPQRPFPHRRPAGHRAQR